MNSRDGEQHWYELAAAYGIKLGVANARIKELEAELAEAARGRDIAKMRIRELEAHVLESEHRARMRIKELEAHVLESATLALPEALPPQGAENGAKGEEGFGGKG